jgi:phosphohistidine phosphatase
MYLYLVQHGASKSEAEDPRRGLTDDGRRVVNDVAEHLAAIGVSVDRLEHSEKLRASQTAEILASKLRPREGTQLVSAIGPNDSVRPMRDRLQLEQKDLMLVGHLPYLSRLLSLLLAGDEERTLIDFQMGGVIRLLRSDGEWRLQWAAPPSLLRSSAATSRQVA